MQEDRDHGEDRQNLRQFAQLQDTTDSRQSGSGVRQQTCCSCCKSCTKPFLTSSHHLDENASLFRRCWHNCLCPPHSRVGAILFVIFITATGWATLVSITESSALPGGNLFALFFLFIACWCGGYLMQLVHLPPLLGRGPKIRNLSPSLFNEPILFPYTKFISCGSGMLLVGGVLGNAPHINIARDIQPEWSSGCRLIALTVILIRAGLGLDPKALKRLSFVVIRLAFSPCLVETVVDAVAAHLILGFPWSWAFMLGFVIAAVSPAVVVPSLLSLSDQGYGVDKGVPTLVIAASSVDDVLAITGFGVMLGISFSSGDIAWTLVKGPLEAIVGIAYGVVTGLICWYIPQKSSKHLVLFRSSLLMAMGLMAVFGSKRLEWAGAGPLAALTLAFVAAFKWREECGEGERNAVEEVEGVLWMLFQPLLFGLIGAEVDVASLNPQTLGLGLAVLFIGLVFRMATSFFAVFRTDLNMKERLFIPIAWLPKATVQAAVGAVAYDAAVDINDPDKIELGKRVMELAVLSILVTAPLGSVAISLAGTRLLQKSQRSNLELEANEPMKADVESREEEEVANSNML